MEAGAGALAATGNAAAVAAAAGVDDGCNRDGGRLDNMVLGEGFVGSFSSASSFAFFFFLLFLPEKFGSDLCIDHFLHCSMHGM